MHFVTKASRTARWIPAYLWQRLTRRAIKDPVHLVIALADHFEPAIVSHAGSARAPYHVQESRVDSWCREYPQAVAAWRDNEGRPFVHSYFYPAEQYDKGLLDRLAQHCSAGWGEIEIHLHHGTTAPDSSENTRRLLTQFRDTLAYDHGALSYMDNSDLPQYAFVHGNFALANSAAGMNCGVDDEMLILAETGCYADFTLPAAPFHPAQISRINSLYECGLSLARRAPHRKGRDLRSGQRPAIFPLMVQGPLLPDFALSNRSRRFGIENGALTGANPPSLHRLQLWKRASIGVKGRPDWLFIKLHCHSMDPTQRDAVLGASWQRFLDELVQGAAARGEILHFVSAREMTNIILAACDGKDGNPGEYRDYRLKRSAIPSSSRGREKGSQAMVRG